MCLCFIHRSGKMSKDFFAIEPLQQKTLQLAAALKHGHFDRNWWACHHNWMCWQKWACWQIGSDWLFGFRQGFEGQQAAVSEDMPLNCDMCCKLPFNKTAELPTFSLINIWIKSEYYTTRQQCLIVQYFPPLFLCWNSLTHYEHYYE